jgi:hypothetical protein
MGEENAVFDGYCPVNRITDLMGHPDDMLDDPTESPASHPRRVNGHRHRLEKLLGVGGG